MNYEVEPMTVDRQWKKKPKYINILIKYFLNHCFEFL